MPIDPTGTAPGVSIPPKEQEKVHMRCKREGCDSILAFEVRLPELEGGARRMYRCVKCHHTQGVLTGGPFNFF
jgi:hypothetical protein